MSMCRKGKDLILAGSIDGRSPREAWYVYRQKPKERPR
jgi:hypothetical protein